MRLVASFPRALRIRIEMKPRLPFKLHRINRKPRYLSPSAISAFFSFLSRSTLYRSDTLQASPIEISTKTSVSSCDTNITRRIDAVPSFLRSRVPLLRRNNCNPLPSGNTAFNPLLARGRNSLPIVLPRICTSRRVASPLSNELTFRETFVSGFNFSFRDFRRDSEDDWPSAFRICLWRDQETLSFLVLGYYCTNGVALIVKFL